MNKACGLSVKTEGPLINGSCKHLMSKNEIECGDVFDMVRFMMMKYQLDIRYCLIRRVLGLRNITKHS